ncbi:MAG: S9 family peptidase [Cytophagales bacterium]|nr:S9 family peptidase [Armatimonadota bacterium]
MNSSQSSSSPAQDENDGYRLPPPEVVEILDAMPTPFAVLSPDRAAMLLVDYRPYPSIALLARPYLKLAGLRIDPTIHATQRVTEYTGLSILRVEDGTTTPITGLPGDARIGVPNWTIDGKRFAFTRDTETGVELWVGEAEAASCRRLLGPIVADILAGPMLWLDDSRHLLVTLRPEGRGPAPAAALVPVGPVVSETVGKKTRASTFQDLLASPHDEDLFEYYATSQLARLDCETGEIFLLGDPCLLLGTRTSPDENHLLVTRLHRPFSYRVPYSYFARRVEIWDGATGALVHTVADLPVSDEVPQQGVPLGPRGVTWQEKKPATLLWVEALDGGDPLAKVTHRDRIWTLPAPFEGEPRELLRITHRFAGWDWLQTEDHVLLTEYDRDRRWRTTRRLNLSQPEDTGHVLFDLSVNDAYNDPGSPIYSIKPNGERSILQDGDLIYLSGRGATPEGDRPFLDAFSLDTHAKERLFECDDASYESFIAFTGDGRGEERKTFLVSFQTPARPANYFVHDRATGLRRALTHFPDPHPQLTGLKKELFKYERELDGVPLSGTLYLPPDYDPSSGRRLPLLLWAYPEEYSDAATAGQVRGSTQTFTRLAGTSPLWFVTQGYAVLNDATMPVVGDPETANDTFVEQIVGAAKAAVDALHARGIIDPARVVVAGHSYGAFMTANLLAHAPGLFAAGIARSGAYNRTLTPWGFQSERRSFWEATDIYINLSPFTHADKIKDPLLLIHGQADNNPGTFTVQSERMYQALQGTGATARLVLLPHESHGYRARESVLHVLAEMFDWADKHAKGR